MNIEKSALVDMLAREAVRGVKTRILAQALTEYVEHPETCEEGSKDETGRVKGCSCGLDELLAEVDSL